MMRATIGPNRGRVKWLSANHGDSNE